MITSNDVPKKIRRIREKLTPEYFIKMGDAVIQAYWTGKQFIAVIFVDHEYVGFVSSEGYGTNKCADVLHDAFYYLERAPKGYHYSATLFRYHKGGNYYLVPLREVRQYV